MRSLPVALAALLSGFLLVVPGGGSAHADTCAAPAYPSAHGRYTSDVKAKGLSCAKAYRLMTKEYTCRVKNGPTGRCVKRVMHFGCRDERYSDFYGSTYVATVTCSLRHKKVTWSYEQSKTEA